MIRKIEGDKIGEQWEWCKQEVKMRAIERSTVVRYEQKIIQKTLSSNLEKLIREECNAPGVFSEDIRNTKQKLDDECYRGALLRARVDRLAGGEAPTKRLSFPYPSGNMASEVCLLAFLTVVENVRLTLGKRGNLTERSPCLVLSLVLTVPAVLGAVYFLVWQTYVLRLDLVLAAGQVALQALQTLLAIGTLASVAK
ncbi:hypothetical protein HPB48_020421 [Haemaphysalis longicornis]|uniref:Uncharacterized protein n=1 Tax=Haemaphysalis longicornis TaxID=44386 RepID=A0A9J6GX52_HAELO|nr:hypothetical protein HPB48_020421 [Haemaphysalis longicornis]